MMMAKVRAKGSTRLINKIMEQHRSTLEPHKLNGITEVHKAASESDKFRIGSYASVVDLDWHGTGCAGKMLHEIFFETYGKKYGMERMLSKFCQEIELLSRMKHPNIVQFFGIHYSATSCLPVLVMESLQCSLTGFLETHEKGSLDEAMELSILLDVSKGLVYLHEVQQVAHRDLSSNNILLTTHMNAKIADLGSARILDEPGGWNIKTSLTMQPGTQDFMPPEALQKPPRYTVSVDVFSFGCVIIHLCTHQWPKPVGKTFDGKLISEYERRKEIISIMGESHFLLSLIKWCLEDEDSSNKRIRPTSKVVMSSIQGFIAARETEKYVANACIYIHVRSFHRVIA